MEFQQGDEFLRKCEAKIWLDSTNLEFDCLLIKSEFHTANETYHVYSRVFFFFFNF